MSLLTKAYPRWVPDLKISHWRLWLVLPRLSMPRTPPSLVAFAQTNKHQYSTSSRFLFRTIRITLGDTEEPERLRRELTRWEAMLRRSGAFAYVRRLIFYSIDFKREMLDKPLPSAGAV